MIDKWELVELKRKRTDASALWYEACALLREAETQRVKTYAAYKKADEAYAKALVELKGDQGSRYIRSRIAFDILPVKVTQTK